MQTRERSEQSVMAMGLVSTFIFNPSYENYMQFSLHFKILEENSPEILKYLSAPMFSESVAPLIQHSKAYILMNSIKDANREQNASEAIELLCKLLQSDPNNSLLWNTLSYTLTKLDSLTQNLQEKLFALTHQHKQTPMQFKAFCSGQSIVHNEKFAPTWTDLGFAFSKGASLTDLPQACRDQHFQGKENLSGIQLQAFCYGQSIVHDEKYAYAWNGLGFAFSNGANLTDLSQACRDTPFQGKENFSSTQLQAFCYGQSILCDEKYESAWSNLGYAFSNGASLDDLPHACRDTLFKGKENLSGTQLQSFCFGQSIVCDEKYALAWLNLGNTFSRGATLADLPQACREQHFQGKENLSGSQLQAFCYGQSIVHDGKYAHAWSSLGFAFANGASLADLPQACREQHFKGKENLSGSQLQAFCCGQSIVHDEKNARAWNGLGFAFSNGANLTDLSQACREQHFQGKENLSGSQLQAFCFAKSAALKNPSSNPHFSATSSAETNSSAASSHKRKPDEALKNPSKKQKTTHSTRPSITQPTTSHPSSTSSTTSSSSMLQAVTPSGLINHPLPHAFNDGNGYYFPNTLGMAVPQYPNALNTHPHAFNDGNGYPIPPARPPQPLPPFTMPPHPGFFQRINAPTQNPQSEVQITGADTIPALDNLAHQANLFPSLVKIKEEPAETQKANQDLQNNGSHSKKM